MRTRRRRSLRVIRDPVHDYIPLSDLELSVVTSPLFQRLRYVSQNGLAHLVYPSNRTPRFTHSLGCMHLGGRLFLAALRNATPTVTGEFVADGRLLLSSLGLLVNPGRVERYLRERDDPLYAHQGLQLGSATISSHSFNWSDVSELTVEIVVLQALRLACLIHDLGHFPFSHTLEVVLTAYAEGIGEGAVNDEEDFSTAYKLLPAPGQPLHERVGQHLIEYIFRDADPDETQTGHSFGQLCMTVAFAIVRGEAAAGWKDPRGVIAALHGIVSSDFDADRADFVQRDGYASGSEFGTFDIERLVTSMQIVKPEGCYLIRPSVLALSAAESFFVERLRSYRWLVFHHGVRRADLCLQRATHFLLTAYFHPTPANQHLKPVLDAYDFPRLWRPFTSQKQLEAYAACDENWLLALFATVRSRLTKAPEERLLTIYLDVILHREKSLMRPLWKRLEEYEAFAADVTAAVQAPSPTPDSPTPAGRLNVLLRSALVAGPKHTRELTMLQEFEQEIKSAWAGSMGTVLFSYAGDFKPGPSGDEPRFDLVDARTATTQNLCLLSTHVAQLRNIWERDVQLWAYFVPDAPPEDSVFTESAVNDTAVRASLAKPFAEVLGNRLTVAMAER